MFLGVLCVRVGVCVIVFRSVWCLVGVCSSVDVCFVGVCVV